MRRARFLASFFTGISLTIVSGLAMGAQPSTATVGSGGVVKYIEKGQPPVVIHLTVEQAQSMRASHPSHGKPGGGSSTNNLIYNGGTGGIGVTVWPWPMDRCLARGG